MLDIALIRENPEFVRAKLRDLNDFDALARVDSVLELDKQRRELLQNSESLQAHRNKLNKLFGQMRGDKSLNGGVSLMRSYHVALALGQRDYDRALEILEGKHDDKLTYTGETLSLSITFEMVTNALRDMSEQHAAMTERIRQIEAELREVMLWIPNLPDDSVPVFPDDSHNIPHAPEGAMPEFDFTPKPHWELGVELGIIDFERGVRMSGSRFYVLAGWGARLQRALIALCLDVTREHGFTELYLPYLVRAEMLEGAAQFPKFRDVVYSDPEADLYLLPTAEVAITNLHRDEILDEETLPRYYVAQTPCFRHERAAAGRDVRGIKRVHQFEKVEMYKFTTPETSNAELEHMIETASDILRRLALPFRRLEIVSGDLGFSASKKFDIEVWAAGCQEWLEVSSCSNVRDFQARRAMIRYYPKGTKKAQYVHTLNGSAFGIPRVLIALLENYQQQDGSVIIPDALRPYLGGAERIPHP